MAGRMAYNTPWELAKVDMELFGETADSSNREEILQVSIVFYKFLRYMLNTVKKSKMNGNKERSLNIYQIHCLLNP